MKNKIVGIALCIVIIALSVFGSTSVKNQNMNRYHQHLKAKNTNAVCHHAPDIFCTALPIIAIDTEDGKPISAKGTQKAEQTTAKISFYNNETEKNHLTDKPEAVYTARLRIRGNSSAHFYKNQYKIELTDKQGKSEKHSLLGMGASDDWVLGAPALDKTLIRNYISYNIFGQISKYTPNVRFCEGYINGKYQGVYLLTESIQVGEDFINVTKPKKNSTMTSYLLRLDRYSPTAVTLNDFFFYSGVIRESRAEVLYPTKAKITEKNKRYIEKDLSYIQRVLYSYDYNSKEYGYLKLLNVNSFVDYFLINEFSLNYDAGIYSTYLYKDLHGKLTLGPIWDYNNAYDNYMEIQRNPTGFRLQTEPWFKMLIKDKAFVNLVIARYHTLRKTVFDEDYLLNYIDQTVEYLGDAVQRNYEVWGYTFDVSKLDDRNKLFPDERNPKSFDEAIEQLKNCIKRRIEWLDKNIDTLRFYSDDSINKRYNNAK